MNMFKLCFTFGIFLICLVLISGKQIDKTECGYNSCTKPKKGFLNVHMLAHTHDDVGWLKTVDQYYYGNSENIQKAGVQYIIDSVVSSLLMDPNRKFIYVEVVFFWKWWVKQSKHVQNQVKKLVNEGRLEFIGGGWSMHDEAATHYQSMVDQMSWGFRRLDDIFGQCGRPRIGWQIDPFGHSRESASIMARFGFDGLLFGRLDYQEKQQRFFNKTAEMVWEASANLGKEADLFTSVLYNLYSPPDWFCFDIMCGDNPVIDDIDSPEYNADKRASSFLTYVNTMAENYKTSNLLITMGMDFHFQGAHKNFINIDRLIKAVNALQSNGSKVDLFYSTPSCYIKALNDEDISWPTKSDDFFPYGSEPHAYWTGYFTSRPALKYFERLGNNFLQVCKQLYTLGEIDQSEITKLDKMREAMGILQHHDAITGTEKQKVAYDYARQLNIGFEECGRITDMALRKLMIEGKSTKKTTNSSLSDILLDSCMLLNTSSCDITETSDNFVVTLYNPMSRKVSQNVRLPVPGNRTNYVIYDPSGATQTLQIVPIHESVKKIPGRRSSASVEIVFVASDLPPLGYRSYYVTSEEALVGKPKILSSKPFVPNNFEVKQSFWWYQSYPGYNFGSNTRASGAYIFRPQGDPKKISQSNGTQYYTGPVVDEIHQVFNSWVSQVIRKYKGSNNTEYHWLIGPIPIDDQVGKEIVTRYTIKNLKTNKIFYTDSNGREMLQRILNYRPSYKVDLQEPVAGNYYPVNTRIMIKNTTNQISVITDRSHGGASINDGEVELMLHRRILYDDGLGVGEALNEEAFGKGLVVRGMHTVTSGDPASQSASDRFLVQQNVLSVWTFFTETQKTFDEWISSYNMEYSGLKTALPSNVQITTLEPWKQNSYLLRLEHIMEKNDDKEWSKPVNVNLKNIFSPFEVTSIEETTLGGNLLLKKNKRLLWKKQSMESEDEKYTTKEDNSSSSSIIKLSPMEIRSFIIKLEFN